MGEFQESIFKYSISKDPTSLIYQQLNLDLLDQHTKSKLELDYEWDYQNDPIITPTIVLVRI